MDQQLVVLPPRLGNLAILCCFYNSLGRIEVILNSDLTNKDAVENVKVISGDLAVEVSICKYVILIVVNESVEEVSISHGDTVLTIEINSCITV